MIAFDFTQFQSSLSKLATAIMTREKTTYLAYASQYQTMSQQLEHQLENKESEVEALLHKIQTDEESILHRIKCELANRSRDHISEITALRAKVSRMRSEQESAAFEIRENVKQEYDELVNSLFSTSFSLKNRFEEYRCNLYEDVVESLCDIRKQALTRLKLITVGAIDSDSKHERGIRHAENLRDVQSENSMLSVLVLKMRTMNDWKRTGIRSFYGKKIFKANEDASQFKRALFEIKLLAQEQHSQSSNEITALRAELASQKQTILALQRELREEKKVKGALQQWKTQKTQLLASLNDQSKLWEKIKHLDIEEVLDAHENHGLVLKEMAKESNEAARINQIAEQRLRNEAKALHVQLSEEKKIKNDALAQLMHLNAVFADLEITPPPAEGYTPGDLAKRSPSKRPTAPSGERIDYNPAASRERASNSYVPQRPSSAHSFNKRPSSASPRKGRPSSGTVGGRPGSASVSASTSRLDASSAATSSIGRGVRHRTSIPFQDPSPTLSPSLMDGGWLDGDGTGASTEFESVRRLSSFESGGGHARGFGAGSRRGHDLGNLP
jgi:hypothetical protein